MDVLDFAMKMEKEGKAYYEKLAAGTKSEGVRNVFTMIAEEEQRHYDLFSSLKAGAFSGFGESKFVDKAKNVFDDMVARKEFENQVVRPREAEIEAYHHAVKMEEDSIRLYRDMAAKEEDEKAKILLSYLVEEEKKHYTIFQNLYDFALKPEYFLQWREFTNIDEML